MSPLKIEGSNPQGAIHSQEYQGITPAQLNQLLGVPLFRIVSVGQFSTLLSFDGEQIFPLATNLITRRGGKTTSRTEIYFPDAIRLDRDSAELEVRLLRPPAVWHFSFTK